MPNDIQIFRVDKDDFKAEIRSIIGDDGEPWFIAGDVCKALGLGNTPTAVSRLDDDEKGSIRIDTIKGLQQVITVNESGLYSLILRSDKPKVKAFKRWVTHEVLPQIRKTGRYDPNNQQEAVLVPTDDLEALKASAIANQANNIIIINAIDRMIALKHTVDHNEKRDDNQDKQIATMQRLLIGMFENGQMTITGYCQARHYEFGGDSQFMAALGRKVARYCRQHNIEYGQIASERWGVKNSYPVEALDAVIPDIWNTVVNLESMTEDELIASEPNESEIG